MRERTRSISKRASRAVPPLRCPHVSSTVIAPPPEVAALARALPDSLPPDVLFGIGGGSGFGRFVYGDIVTLLTRVTTRETAREAFLADICRNLQIPYRSEERRVGKEARCR